MSRIRGEKATEGKSLAKPPTKKGGKKRAQDSRVGEKEKLGRR